MRKLLGIIISIIIFSSCEKQNEMFFPPEVGDVTLYGITAKTVYAESYIEDSKNIDVDECGFCVYPNDDKTDVRYVKAVLSNGMFSVKIDSLKPGTDYRIKAYARNAVGIGYSDSEKICKTSLSVAEISTNNVLDITPTTAVCGGNITSDGGLQVTERGVCWSTSHNPTIYNNRTTDGTGIGSFTSSITDLTNETTYYVRAYATNSMGTAYGDEKCFLTTAKPTVMTRLVTDVSDTSAVCGGNVTSIGSSPLTARGVCWATHHNPTIDDDKTFDGVDVGEFISNITELTEGTVYHVRAYATNEVGTSYGEEITFTTLTLPTISTNEVTNVSFTTATCGGNITSDGGAEVTACGVCWSTSSNPTLDDSHTFNGTGTGSYLSYITGLTAETTYYVRAYATNSVGTAYGEQRIFTTATTVLSTVATSAAYNITETSVVCGGNVTWDGGATVTSRGIVYWTNSNNVSQTVICGSGTGNFTTTLSGLSAGTTYYYKAYSTNSVGTSYGEVMMFNTPVNGHYWVDLGLPSGTLWATCNVGANTPTEYGSYFAWGEPTTKSTFTSSNYTYSSNPSTLPASADAATAQWGASWRMPTYSEMNELLTNCTVTFTMQDGVSGRLFVGPNGNSIFLPAAGYREGVGLYDVGTGNYWTSSCYTNQIFARDFFFDSVVCYINYGNRYLGFSIRPVCSQ